MVPHGEVGLIFASIGHTVLVAGAPVLGDAAFPAIIAMVMLTTLVTPPLLKAAFAKPSDQSNAAPAVVRRLPRPAGSTWNAAALMVSPPVAVAVALDVDDVAMGERMEPRRSSDSCSEAGQLRCFAGCQSRGSTPAKRERMTPPVVSGGRVLLQ